MNYNGEMRMNGLVSSGSAGASPYRNNAPNNAPNDTSNNALNDGRATLLRSHVSLRHNKIAIDKWRLGGIFLLPLHFVFSLLAFLLLCPALVLPLHADEVITNVMSPIASYQYLQDFSSDALTNGGISSPTASYQYLEDFSSAALTDGGVQSPIVSYQYSEDFSSEALVNGGIMSPIVSYQYFEWAGNGVLNLQSSPVVSYYYPLLDAPLLNILPTSRVPSMYETTPAFVLSPPPVPPPSSQLMAFHGGIFTENLVSLDLNQMTIVLTHGWIPTAPVKGDLYSGGPDSWPTDIAKLLRANGVTANIVAWNWTNKAKSTLTDPKAAAVRTPDQGVQLGQALLNKFGSDYAQKIHFIGHSLGTLVNSYAANFLHGDHWADEPMPISKTKWPGTNTHMTLFDEAEVAREFNGFFQDLAYVINRNANPIATPSRPYDHPLPIQFAWADNYVSAVGILQSNAANLILTNKFPIDAPDPKTWFDDFATFHGYPMGWYEETINTDAALMMGFLWSFERGGWFSQAPSAGTVYAQTFHNSQWNLTEENWQSGTNFLDARFQRYRSALLVSSAKVVDNTIIAYGQVFGTPMLSGLNAITLIFKLHTALSNSGTSRVRALPMIDSLSDGTNTNVPAYAWMQLTIPTNAVSMSFNFLILGDWQSDYLAAALNGTNVLSLAGSVIETNKMFTSGAIDIAAFAGQTNEFFIGIVGGTSTNAQLTVQNLVFSVSLSPSLKAQTTGNSIVLTWPISAANYVLEKNTNLTETNLWVAITNVPAIVNLQNAITNPLSSQASFYRLRK